MYVATRNGNKIIIGLLFNIYTEIQAFNQN